MNFRNKVSEILGDALVEIEGFFTERVINLCKSQNIRIWNIINLTDGIVRFEISIKDIKKIKNIVKKSKCKMKVIRKKGLYFQAFKYRKRKLFIVLILLVLIAISIFNKHIWDIEVVGNVDIYTDNIIEAARNSGVNIGKNKNKIDVLYSVKEIQKDIPELAWVGLEFKGTKLLIKVVERTKIPEEMIYDLQMTGDIIASKSGVIKKITVENGTACHEVGSYVLEGMKLIDGTIYSEYMENKRVRASGTIQMEVEYIFEKEYSYYQIEKQYNNKNRYSLGLSFNNKEFYINYLNKRKKYDKLKNSKAFNLFGINFSFDFYTFSEYLENEIHYNESDLLQIARDERNEYISYITLGDAESVIKIIEEFKNEEEKLKYKATIIINENVGIFKGDEIGKN